MIFKVITSLISRILLITLETFIPMNYGQWPIPYNLHKYKLLKQYLLFTQQIFIKFLLCFSKDTEDIMLKKDNVPALLSLKNKCAYT